MTLDGNKDEAQKCINIAISAIREGQIDKAEKFLHKAERLYPTPQAKELLKGLSSANMNKSDGDNAGNVQSEARKRKAAPQQPTAREYTVEQMEYVRRVNKCKDFYELLGVTKSSPDTEVKKAYKKLALQLHPDKNHAPGAGEAFKAIGNAAAVLTDPERRKQYDLRGDESTHTAAQHNRHQYYARGFESDLTAEELFNMFFGAGGQHVYTRRRYQQREPQEGQREGSNSLLQLLPVLFLVVISMMSGFFINDPVFSLSPSSKFPVARETLNLKIPYYVKDNFHTDYQGSLRRLELTIEEEFLLNLRHACQRERNYKETMTWKARNFGDNKQYQAAQKMATPSCDRLYNLSQR